jgi:beta-glucosidase
VGYGASEAGRDYVYTEISDQTLWDTYLPPYEAAVKAGAATLMSSFNDISGTPGTANTYLLRTVLKEQWKHDGFVVSDWGAIEQLRSQGVAKDKKEAASKAFNAGVEMDMMNQSYDKHLATLVKEGKVTQAVLDDAVKRVLRIKFRLGLFEKPYTPEIAEKKRFLLPESRAVAARLAEESIVLLKNEHSTLPLAALKSIAVIGPMSNSKWHLLGSWRAHGNAEDASTIYENIKQEFGNKIMVTNTQGCDFDGTDQSGFAEASRLAKNADAVVICLGEKANWSGENASRSTISLPAIQEELLTELKKSGKPVILLLSSGHPLDLSRLEPLCDAILTLWQPGTTGGKAVAEVLSGKINPSGKLAMTFPYSTGQIPIYYNHRQSARPNQGKYQDITSKPLYDFGHGLSYTTFEYAELKASSASIKTNGNVMVEVAVKNTGNRDGMETVHWFISDPVSSISRPVKELKFFQKQFIRKGETKVFRFQIDPKRDLGFVNARGEKFVEEGDYYIIVKDQKIKIELLRE